MASSVQRGVTFFLVIRLSASTKIKPQQQEKIFEYIKSQLPLFKKHVHTVEEITFFDIIGITKDAKSDIRLEFSVSDSKDLENFFQFAKYSQQQDKKNGLSYIFTTFFQNQEMQLKCGFPSSTKINILVGISEKEKKKLAANLEKRLAKISEESKKKDNSM
ncbi:uncharacterized protein LOC128554411, partial [Mercenaria mercenaria]|uniref:uncharacterized protein LOC128554411 n=1 Tax=Mercenaria mercenaria TaxID=6596 RepID=UPI00234E69A6